MNIALATDNDTRNSPIYEQLFAFAYAYLNAAKVLCVKAVDNADARDWAAGSVVLMNASHAVELFLKATLLRSDEAMNVWAYGHDISRLADEYEKRFRKPEMSWDILFRRPKPDELSPEEAGIYKKFVADPSIEFRYPHARLGEPWLTLHAFEPHSFSRDLDRIENDFDRIRQAMIQNDDSN